MNIFYVDEDPVIAAQLNMDAHVKKIPLEMAQMFCTNLWIDHIFDAPRGFLEIEDFRFMRDIIGYYKATDNRKVPYWPTMHNHGCTIWLRESLENWQWGLEYTYALEAERQYRFGSGKEHKSVTVVRGLSTPRNFVTTGFTQPYRAVTDPERDLPPVQAYRAYYNSSKQHLATWSKRDIPEWFEHD